MIDLNLYRCRIGIFYNSKRRSSHKISITGNRVPDFGFVDVLLLQLTLYIYLYFNLCVLGVIIGMLCECRFKSFPLNRYQSITNLEFAHSFHSHVKLFSVILVYYLWKRNLHTFLLAGSPSKFLRRIRFHSLFTTRKCNSDSSFLQFCARTVKILINGSLLWTFLLNSMLIVIVNPSLLNPGPTRFLKVMSFNAHGLLPFSQLDNNNPTLDITKIFELQYYISDQNPDILMLNETWLKKSVSDSEVIPMNDYKVFRLDRSYQTHPPDPSNPNKFRRNGGGVLIAVRRDLDVVSTKLEFKCAAEILGITLKFGDGKKIILCSFYRVGTLGARNHTEFLEFIRKARSRRGVTGIVLAGDFNMPHINWEDFSSTEAVDQLFLDSFSNLGLEQLVNDPTHTKGNILDLLLTDRPQLVSDLNVSDSNLPCKSDHFAVSFIIKSKVDRIRTVKREALNFKKANWSALNSDLGAVNWEHILTGDIETAWATFKETLECSIERHIPKIKIGGKPQPPWFDAEIHQACRRKERLHSVYKGTTDPSLRAQRYFKFSNSRSEFKNLVTSKLSTSFEDNDDPNKITKKFWSYVKATSNNTRIPELVHLDGVYKNASLDQANLFNTFFYQEFSNPSRYDIPIESDNHALDIDFSTYRISSILSKLNPSKAIGPDKIHSSVLKNCSAPISIALKILFNKSYNSGSLLRE